MFHGGESLRAIISLILSIYLHAYINFYFFSYFPVIYEGFMVEGVVKKFESQFSQAGTKFY